MDGDRVKQTEQVQQIVLAIRRDSRETDAHFEERRAELIGLCEAAGGELVAELVQERSNTDSALYLGSGKIGEVAEAVETTGAQVTIFDGELSPAQVRNLESRLGCRVIDRTQLILDIFAMRAKSREGRLQVEIAQLQYMLPRLTGHGVAMSRLGGGIGTRGPGETKLEVDRRRIRHRISHMREALNQVRRVRQVQREKRARSVPVVAIVGYTNAGKTTLVQRWTTDRGTPGASTGNARLFDTLDPSARRVKAGTASDLVLLDTVGFVENLPHQLVDAFRATLEEVLEADLIVHVVDGSRDAQTHLATTYQVLGEIKALDKPVITFFNKMDATAQHPAPDVRATVSVFGSALTGAHMGQLYREVDRLLELDPVQITLTGDRASEAFWKDISKSGRVLECVDVDAGQVHITMEVERREASRLRDRFAQRPPFHPSSAHHLEQEWQPR